VSGFVLREATPRDVARVLALYRAEGHATSAESVAAAIAREDACAVVALGADGTLLGFGKTHRWDAALGPAPAGLYLGGALVRSSARRRGVGLTLVRHRLAWAAARGEAPVLSVTNALNAASITMHRAAGFVETARAPGMRGVVEASREGILWQWRPRIGGLRTSCVDGAR